MAAAQIGYNWHVMPQWVVGIEADLQAGNAKDRVNCFLPCNTPIAITTGIASAFFPVMFSEISAESELNWFGTVRGRIGRASGPAFFYFTGGLAYGEVTTRGRVAGTSFNLLGPDPTFAGSYDYERDQNRLDLGQRPRGAACRQLVAEDRISLRGSRQGREHL